MSAAGEDLARVTVISPTRRIDLALPGGTTLGEIMPNIVRFSGYEGGSAADVVHNWVLQRFGEDPLDVTSDVSSLDIRDGETLHLRQLEAAMPDAAFDDVVDAVATSTTTQPAWNSRHSQRGALILAALFLIGLPTLLLIRQSTLLGALAALVLSFGAGLAAVLASRAFGKLPSAVALGWMSVILGGLGGFHLLQQGLAIAVLTAAAGVLLTAGVLGLAARVTTFGFLSVALSAMVMIIVQITAVAWPAQEVAASAVAVALLMGLTIVLPALSFRLARIALPNLPSSSDQLIADETPVQSDIVIRAVMADKLLGAFLTATAITVTIGCLQVLRHGSIWAVLLTAAVALALMLRSRSFIGFSHRLALLASGMAVATMALSATLFMINNDVLRIGLGLGVGITACVILTAYGTSFADKIISPVWGRLGDIVEWIAIMAIVPLVLAVLDAYTFALGLAG
ncbi:MAG: type VII secretion integral membrane protein EccD [Propionibacteriales bacterium]|nr:type VII secretion integral membrane protein EccD [Propionibacteriales bacterium]